MSAPEQRSTCCPSYTLRYRDRGHDLDGVAGATGRAPVIGGTCRGWQLERIIFPLPSVCAEVPNETENAACSVCRRDGGRQLSRQLRVADRNGSAAGPSRAS